jgi:hypothetical protein
MINASPLPVTPKIWQTLLVCEQALETILQRRHIGILMLLKLKGLGQDFDRPLPKTRAEPGLET